MEDHPELLDLVANWRGSTDKVFVVGMLCLKPLPVVEIEVWCNDHCEGDAWGKRWARWLILKTKGGSGTLIELMKPNSIVD